MAMSSQPPQVDLKVLKNLLGGSLIWVGLALLVIVLTVMFCIRVGKVGSSEVGLLLNRISGDIEVVHQSGVRVYNGITHEFYTLDKTLQTPLLISSMTGGTAEAGAINRTLAQAAQEMGMAMGVLRRSESLRRQSLLRGAALLCGAAS